MKKQIRVTYMDEDNSYIELWKNLNPTKDTRKYYGRMTDYMPGTWYALSDPFGYREPSEVIRPEIEFIICDPHGKEILRDSNGNHNQEFTSLSISCKEALKRISETYPVTKDERSWLETFLDEKTRKDERSWLETFLDEKTRQEIQNNSTCSMDTWDICYDVKEKNIILEFSYAGIPLCFYDITCVHRICKVEWHTFFVGKKYMDEYDSYLMYWGCIHGEPGPIIPTLAAVNILKKAIMKEVEGKYYYRMQNDGIYYVKESIQHYAKTFIGLKRWTKQELDDVIESKAWKEQGFYMTEQALLQDFPEAKYHYYTLWD